MTQEVTRKVVRNAAFNVLGRAWFLGMSLILTPYLLAGLGKQAYGIWILVDSLVRTIALLDFGFGTSFVKFVAEYDARGERERVNGVLAAGLLFYAGLGVALACVAIFAVDALLGFFTVPPALAAEARSALRIAIAACICANLMGVYLSIINGLQRMGSTNAIMTVLSVFWAAGCVVVVERGLGIRGLAQAQLATQVLGIALAMAIAMAIYPGLRPSLRGIRGVGGQLFRYGANVYVGNVAALVNVHFDKLLVNRFLDASHVAYYDVGARPANTARSFGVLLLSALTPATSEIEAREGRGNLYGLFVRTSRLLAMTAFPLFLGLAVTGAPLVTAWVGPGYGVSASVLAILCVGTLFASLAAAVVPMVQGMGWPQCQRNAEAISLVLNVLLSTALIIRFGFLGAVVGTSVAMTVASAYYLIAFHRFVDRPLGPFLRQAWLKPALCALAAAALAGASGTLLFSGPDDARLRSLGVALAVATVFGASYAGLLLASGQLDAAERTQLAGLISRSRARRNAARSTSEGHEGPEDRGDR